MKIIRALAFVLFCTCSPVFAVSPINAWTNPASGNWEDLKWSLGSRPGPGQSIMLTNQGWKAVAIGPATSQNFPQSLSVDNVVIAGNTDSFNVLLLNYAGTSVPLQASNGLAIFAGGEVQNLYSGLIVQNGSLTVSNSDFIQVGGFVATTNAWLRLFNSTYHLTNGLLQAGQVTLGEQSTASFVQDGGAANMTSLTLGVGLIGGGAYDLYSGWLYVSGTLTLEGLQGVAAFNQHGGTNFVGTLQLSPFNGESEYNLSGGMLCANSAYVFADVSADFTQTGGQAFITNTFKIQGYNRHPDSAYVGSCLLSGGTLSVGSLDINGNDGYSVYTQSNGTARVAGNLYLNGGSHIGDLKLAGGTLACSNIFYSGSGDCIKQTGGALIVSNLFSFGGTWTPWWYPSGSLPIYTFNGGTLSASNMELYAEWYIGSSAQAGRISNPGWFKLGFTTLHIGDADEDLGRFILTTNAIDYYAQFVVTNSFIALDGSSSKLGFADSSAETWVPGATLIIKNWNGNPSGGGAEQLKFGASASGLTASQLARIQFSNPSGYASGNYPAQLLSTGELVPAGGGGPPPGLVNSWTNPASGNWEDLKWSLGIRPASNQTIMITNQGWKAVAIGANTAQNFPQSLNVSNVFLGGYTDSFNVLLLNYAGFVVPLTTGSVNVGTNSGITALGSVLTVSSNSGPGDLSIFSAFNQGDQAIVNAHTINLGNVTNSGAGPGIYNQTNGTINADEMSEAFGSTFNQFNGSNTVGRLWMGANSSGNHGQYNMVNGYLTAAGGIEMYRGDFHQTGGSVTAGLGLGDATYTLSAGTLRMQGITIPQVECSLRNPCPNTISGNATLLQTGGTNFCDGPMTVFNSRSLPGVGADFFGPGHYVLSNGVLYVSSTVNSGNYDGGGDFQQWGGWHTNAGTHVIGVDDGQLGGLRRSSFTLGGGTMVTASISIDYGSLVQSGGTNRVSGDVDVGTGDGDAKFMLSGGLLVDQNTTIDLTDDEYFGAAHVLFAQSGGTHIVTNLLRVSGPFPLRYSSYPPFSSSAYVLSNGVLNAANIQIDGGGYFEHDGGTLTASMLLILADGAWNENTTGQQFGQLLLSAPAGSNANFSLPSGNCIVRFANSSAQAWNPGALLYINNWHGSPSGGGASQLCFGSNSSGLTAQQLAQIQFAISGTNYPAAILATGEVVPNNGGTVTNSRPMLQAARNGNTLTLQWGPGWVLQSATNVTGPYQDVSGATNPWPVSMTKPREFFRLRSINGAANFANDANTVALYHFDSTNTPFADSSGHGYTLSSHGNVVLANNATWMGSPTGLVARFSAVGDYLELTSIPDASVLPANSSPLTIETRIYPRAYQSSTAAYLLELYQDFDTFWAIYTPGTSNPNIPQVYAPSASIMLSATDWNQLVTLNTWHSIKITVAANGISQLYIDGTLAGSSNVSPNYGRTSNWTLHLGDFNGDLDEVRISNIVR